MKKEYVEINGVTFEVKKVTADELMSLASRVRGTTQPLEWCYDRCSDAKKVIYKTWKAWASSLDHLQDFDVFSYNTSMFTLAGVNRTKGGFVVNVIKITPAHNYIYVMK